ncbi:helix-turn-helix domain-containing protein [Arthrobacter sp. VKM Ac-2550]|uniref:helix-turn-helix domain-containing protein n=1 Tax=Crystallibacter permensis TaxID=1938888 RepID=UPI002227B664|nr:helix-turn-helix transcriptional regulator [Arthrobacter sp. VKM Ac-2550]
MKIRDREQFKELLTRNSPRFICTASELARRAGVHYSFISHLKDGRKSTCTPKTAALISVSLGVEIDSIFVPKITTASSAFDNQKMVA